MSRLNCPLIFFFTQFLPTVRFTSLHPLDPISISSNCIALRLPKHCQTPIAVLNTRWSPVPSLIITQSALSSSDVPTAVDRVALSREEGQEEMKLAKVDRTVLCFFVLFLSVYFLESIGGFYMTSAIVSIEKQFQIPSKISGMMVSAGDFGYIPAVVFVSYMGSKGNRARWIGGGAILIAIANLLIGSSHFLFPIERVSLNTTTLEKEIERDIRRLPANIGMNQLLAELPSRESRFRLREQISDSEQLDWLVQLLERCISHNQQNGKQKATGREKGWESQESCQAFSHFLHKHNPANQSDVDNLRVLSATSYAFCDKTLNSLRTTIEQIRCGRNNSHVGPTATIFLGLLILGVGRTMPFSLGLPLIDDNVRKNNLPLYFAGMFCIRIMGPMLGFQMGAFFNKLYYSGEAPHGITPRDPMWIGCWWGGFLAIGGILFLPSLFLFCFRNPQQKEESSSSEGKDNKGEGEKRPARGLALVDRHLEKDADGTARVPKGLAACTRDFMQTISTVVRQPVYRWAMAGRIIDVLAFKGFHIFLPKYLELQFGIPQYEVNRLLGVIGVLAFAIGVLCGSLAMRGFRLQGRRAATWVAAVGLLSACFSLMNSAVGCESTMTVLGQSLSSAKSEGRGGGCLLGCNCESAPLYPVCDRNGTVFYSPCHAGCHLTNVTAALNFPNTPVFDGCKCSVGDQVSREFCGDGNCRRRMYWYFTNMAIGGVIGGMGVVPGVMIMLRSVPPKHRSISLGFNGFLVSLLATLPSPIVWGAIIDHFCLYWAKKCDGKGACALYATDKLGMWLHALYGALRLVSLITDLFVIYHAKGLKLTFEDEEGENQEKEDGEEKKMEKRTDNKSNGMGELELREPLQPKEHVHHISCAPPSYEEGDVEQSQQTATKQPVHNSLSLPSRGEKPMRRKSISRAEGMLPVFAEDLEMVRKSSCSHHSIAEL